uniref:pectin lyase n=1 Tax=Clastoptera arizonana TaxID=38151 RepID=A0A1B6CZA1_9HEMI
MMTTFLYPALLLLYFTNLSEAFYTVPPDLSGAIIEVPTTNEELQNALCDKIKGNRCQDDTLKVIRITKEFDFRGTEGYVTETGCYHRSTPICKIQGQLKLNAGNQCSGLEETEVTYDKAGKTPLLVGSNKYIVGDAGAAAIVGKGLEIIDAHDVYIHNLKITDVNSQVIWAGDALSINNSSNVWIDSNYIARIGRQMIVTHFGACRNITISNNEFDGRTLYSDYCDGTHYWLFLFLGSNDTITLFKNFVHDTAGRGPHSCGLKKSQVLIYMANNNFENITHNGLIDSQDAGSRLLVEGNTFTNVSKLVSADDGSIFLPLNEDDTEICEQYLGRKCNLNVVNRPPKSKAAAKIYLDVQVLEELQDYELLDEEQYQANVDKITKELAPYFEENAQNEAIQNVEPMETIKECSKNNSS